MRIVKCDGLLFTLPRAGNCAPEDIRAHVHDLAFRGSYSLKRVLPSLVSGMSEDGMEVADGNEAGLAGRIWFTLRWEATREGSSETS
jgi:hypothetical protein